MEFISKLDPSECELYVLTCPQLTSAELCTSEVFWCWYLTGVSDNSGCLILLPLVALRVAITDVSSCMKQGLTAQHVASTIILDKCSKAGVRKHSRDGKSDYQKIKIHTSEESYARFMVNPR